MSRVSSSKLSLADGDGASILLSDEFEAALDALTEGLIRHGVSRVRAERAVTAWTILGDRSVADALAESDRMDWDQL